MASDSEVDFCEDAEFPPTAAAPKPVVCQFVAVPAPAAKAVATPRGPKYGKSLSGYRGAREGDGKKLMTDMMHAGKRQKKQEKQLTSIIASVQEYSGILDAEAEVDRPTRVRLGVVKNAKRIIGSSVAIWSGTQKPKVSIERRVDVCCSKTHRVAELARHFNVSKTYIRCVMKTVAYCWMALQTYLLQFLMTMYSTLGDVIEWCLDDEKWDETTQILTQRLHPDLFPEQQRAS